jgi:hypothetical protein
MAASRSAASTARRYARLVALGCMVAVSSALGGSSVSPAGAAIPLTPLLDCVSSSGTGANLVYTAYFGYDNSGSVPVTFAVGVNNQVVPGAQNQGQPTEFNVGEYPRVFAVQFDGVFIPSVSWELNGLLATATTSSPPCTAGASAPASDVTPTGATLNGVVTPEGVDTTYTFAYGTSPALGQSTAPVDAGAGTGPQLVQSTLTGLTPSTTYYYQLVATNSMADAPGQIETFTTTANPAPAPPTTPTTPMTPATPTTPATSPDADVSVTLSCPTATKVGKTVTCRVTVHNGGPSPAQDLQTAIALPAGLVIRTFAGNGHRVGDNVLWTVPSLPASQSARFTILVKTERTGDATIDLGAWSQNPDPRPSNNTANRTIRVRR